MTAADDYPELGQWWLVQYPITIQHGRARQALAEIDALRAENARLKAQLADANEADAATHDWINQGGRIT